MALFDLFKRKPAAVPAPAAPASARAEARTTPPGPALPVDTARQAQQKWETELTARAVAWAQALPQDAQAPRLCATLPRLANRLAVVWHDAARSAAVLDELLVDRRGGRQGFAPDISAELRALQVLNQARSSPPSEAAEERPSQ